MTLSFALQGLQDILLTVSGNIAPGYLPNLKLYVHTKACTHIFKQLYLKLLQTDSNQDAVG